MDAVVNGDALIGDAIHALTQDLYQLVSSLQLRPADDSRWVAAYRRKCRELSDRIGELRSSLGTMRTKMTESKEHLYTSLGDVAASLKEYSVALTDPTAHPKMSAIQGKLADSYELLLGQLKRLKWPNRAKVVTLDHIKPRNYARNLVHMGLGLGSVLLYQLVLGWGGAMIALGVATGIFGILETLRRVSPWWRDFMVDTLFKAIARPRDRHKTNSAIYYLLAMTILTFVAPKPGVLVGILVLAFGDPAACIVGKRWGKRKIWQQKSIIGTLGFIGAAMVSSLVYLVLTQPALSIPTMLTITATASILGAVAEIFSTSLDDNLTIPLIAGLTASLWFI